MHFTNLLTYQPSNWLWRLIFAPVKWLAGKTTSEMTLSMSSMMLNPAITNLLQQFNYKNAQNTNFPVLSSLLPWKFF